jgi:hypothetical protein
MVEKADKKVANFEKISCLDNFWKVGSLLVTKKWLDICLHFLIYKVHGFWTGTKFYSKQNF